MTDIQIANSYQMKPITQIAEKLAINSDDLEMYGKFKAKVDITKGQSSQGKLILVTAVNPTPYGEGKTTVSIGIADALGLIGKKCALALREPSLGPVFGIKGGATGGGHSQVVPMEDINLHFTGDFHAITSANNLLSSLIDNHIKQGNELDFDQVTWRRTMDCNDRALRVIDVALGGQVNGVPRRDGFDITAASEVMAVLCLSENLMDLKRRLGNIIVGRSRSGHDILVSDLGAEESMTILLRDAIKPNLVQTLAGTPAFIHGGPFANIAHGCNSIIATKTALSHADYVVTEAGFGAELGAEKFFDIKCRKSGLAPSAVVLVATVRALKYNGYLDKSEIATENLPALENGIVNLVGHIENLKKFGIPVTVAINRFCTDTEAELAFVEDECRKIGVSAHISDGWAKGGAGCVDLARQVVSDCNKESNLRLMYSDSDSIADKINAVAKNVYGAGRVIFSESAEQKLKEIEGTKYARFPVCIAKTQYSFSQDQNLLGRPTGFDFEVRDLLVRGGSEFIVVVCGSVMLMPGLSKTPSAYKMTIDKDGKIEGLF